MGNSSSGSSTHTRTPLCVVVSLFTRCLRVSLFIFSPGTNAHYPAPRSLPMFANRYRIYGPFHDSDRRIYSSFTPVLCLSISHLARYIAGDSFNHAALIGETFVYRKFPRREQENGMADGGRWRRSRGAHKQEINNSNYLWLFVKYMIFYSYSSGGSYVCVRARALARVCVNGERRDIGPELFLKYLYICFCASSYAHPFSLSIS